ncbi:MAG TPA: glycosyltransferase family 39 protein [Verrucomicrobiae bacterium]|nr:glycosyltransferase family 39 protein [Verrucomicrobiae bacterium]
MTLVASGPPLSRVWLLLIISLFTFFFLLGHRALNEPDEGRYSVIASEMIETSNWLVPQLWYVPHLDKPPLTYWAVAASMKLFGRNEWAVRLPVALAGLSGVAAAFFLGRSLAGQRAGFWSAVILQTSLLYAIASRMLTPDIFVTQFIAWSIYFLWRAWRSFDEPTHPALKRSIAWQCAAWIGISLGFLTKGPIALAVPAAAFGALAWFGREEKQRLRSLLLGTAVGVLIFCAIVLPWFIQIFQTVPGAFDFMVKRQMLGHALGTTEHNRHGPILYYVGILGIGFVPWTVLLFWLWRRSFWSKLQEKEGWVLLNSWIVFTFVVFTFSSSKLPEYVLPLFPALAVLVSLRWFSARPDDASPVLMWRALAALPLAVALAFPLVMHFALQAPFERWMIVQICVAAVVLPCIALLARRTASTCAVIAVCLTLLNFAWTETVIPKIETALKSNQTLKPLALALKQVYRPGDKVVCWRRFPQGLLFYAYPVLCATNRPLLGGMPLDKVPFEFPGNAARFGDLLIPDEAALEKLLAQTNKVWVIGYSGTHEHLQQLHGKPLPLVKRVGQFELFSN